MIAGKIEVDITKCTPELIEAIQRCIDTERNQFFDN